jgi:predicted DCC family thiol-disulfide oxidoreductase YuxK
MKDKAIIYDDNCPMCALYTQGFVNWQILEKANRVPFAQLQQQSFIEQVDWHRAKNEIPLVDLQGGQTLYGLNALIFLLGQKISWLNKLPQYKPLYTLFALLYNLVSYNRRIIVPNKNPALARFDCTPDYHFVYRLAFILVAIASSTGITYAFGQSLNKLLPISSGGIDMLLIAGTGWGIQVLLAILLLKEKRMDYIGHLGVIMLIGVLVLLPGICVSWLTEYQYPAIPFVSVLLSSGLMCRQHFARIRSLGLTQLWTLAWFMVLQATAIFWIYQLYFYD